MWRIYPVVVCYDAGWLKGLWSTQATAEGIVPMTAWHWFRDSSVFNVPLGEPFRTPLYVGFPSVGYLWTVTLSFSPFYRKAAFFVDEHKITVQGDPHILKDGSFLWKKHKVTVHETHAGGMPTYNAVRPGTPRGSLMTLLCLPQFHAVIGMIPYTLACVDQSPVSQRVS